MEKTLCTTFSLWYFVMTKNKTKQNYQNLPLDCLSKKENNYTCSKIVGYLLPLLQQRKSRVAKGKAE